ncbi:NifB/NifX family molybdenum-iron cluster-binding protein [Calditrichota bacterium]
MGVRETKALTNPDTAYSTVKIAISCFGEEIAPCFAVTRRIRVWAFNPDNRLSCDDLIFEETGGLPRVRKMKQLGVNVLICNGIEGHVRQLLESQGCHVITNVFGSATEALYGYLAGKIPLNPENDDLDPSQLQPHTADLVRWTEELFISFGWTVDQLDKTESYLVDLYASINCPVCDKLVKAAICCGAHAYEIRSEIRDFAHITSRGYHSRVYVHHATSQIVEWCRDYEIELLNPMTFISSFSNPPRRAELPPLKNRIKDHNKINKEQSENN